MTVDVHAHCIPDDLVDMLSAEGRSLGVEVLRAEASVRVRIAGTRTTPPLHPLLSDLTARLTAMGRMGVTTQLISPFIDLTAYELDAEEGARWSRLFNDLMAATAATAPDRLLALATVPLQSGELAAAELDRAITTLGMVGVEIGARRPAGHLDDAELTPFWEAADALGSLVLVHPLSGASANEPYFLGNLVSNPAETTMAAARLMFGGVLERFPSLRVCLAHGGGFLPYQVGRLERGYRAIGSSRGARLTTSPLELLRRLYYDTVLHSPDAIGHLVDRVGPDRVLLGSDYPFEMGDPDPIGTVTAVDSLDGDARDLILAGNADRLVGSRLPNA